MTSVSDLWAAIDRLAFDHDITLIELAVESGLPPLSLLPENRVSDGGELAWPSLETILRLVTVAGVSIREFGLLVHEIEGSYGVPDSVSVSRCRPH